jgi:hypothetical protein
MNKHRIGAAVAAAALGLASFSAGAGTAAAREGDGGVWTVVDADGGVYWRSAPGQPYYLEQPGHGVYTDDQIRLEDWLIGEPGPTGNPLWYWAEDLSRNLQPTGDHEMGYINDHYLNTPGTAASPQPQGQECPQGWGP